jgi:predicted PurR-regulated permease PerM
MNLPQTDRLHAALWLGLGLAILALLYLLKPILMPFLLAGVLAYIGNPMVDRLQTLGAPRTVGVLALLLLLSGILIGLVLIVLPLLIDEGEILVERLPEGMALANEKLAPWLRERFGVRLRLDPASLRKFAVSNWDSVQTILEQLLQSLKIGGMALLGMAINLLLTPVVMFYLLLDWHSMRHRLGSIVPRPWKGKIVQMAEDIDDVLSQFLRGQLLVMLALAVYYSFALWLADLPSALAIGLLTGMLVFIPYIGFATGFLLALLVAALQFSGWEPIFAVLVVYGIGQFLESFLLTPFLVGERIGLHPLTVIFALMAFGQIFGFFGVLLALPASAALLVGLREVRQLYLVSPFYRGPV